MKIVHPLLFGVLASLVLAACAPTAPIPAAPASGSTQSTTAAPAAQPARTLQIVGRLEPANLSLKFPNIAAGGSADAEKRVFNALLAYADEHNDTQPYLAAELPKLNTDTWKVNADGTMETIYRLKPNLTWHDGQPLTADDFAFAYQVYSTPALGFRPSPQDQMTDVLAPDPLSVVIRWKGLYPDAGALTDNALPPLPRHLLESSFSKGDPDAFLNQPYWSTEYVGAGPYRLTRWEPGTFLEAEAFPGHVGGPAKIARLRITYASDPNVVVANLLARSVDVAVDDSIRFQHGVTLRSQWDATNAGVVLIAPNVTRYLTFQFRPDIVNPRALLDLRVRQALAHAIDRQELSDALVGGQSPPADSLASYLVSYAPALNQSITKYPYDPQRMAQLLTMAGLSKGSDGFYASAAGERFSPSVRTVGGGQEEQEATVIVDGLRRLGIDSSVALLTTAQARDNETQASFPALTSAQTFLVEDVMLTKLRTPRIPSAENRWTGSNLGGYSNPEYDRLYDQFSSTLDRAQRDQIMVQIMTLVSQNVPNIPLYYNPRVLAALSDLQGPRAGAAFDTFNVQDWEFR